MYSTLDYILLSNINLWRGPLRDYFRHFFATINDVWNENFQIFFAKSRLDATGMHLFFFVHWLVMSLTCGSSIKIVLFCPGSTSIWKKGNRNGKCKGNLLPLIILFPPMKQSNGSWQAQKKRTPYSPPLVSIALHTNYLLYVSTSKTSN